MVLLRIPSAEMANDSTGWIWQRLGAQKKIFFRWPANGTPSKKLCTGALATGSLCPRLDVRSLILALTT